MGSLVSSSATDHAIDLDHPDIESNPLAAAERYAVVNKPDSFQIRYGINNVGNLYEYGPTAATPKRILRNNKDALNSPAGGPEQGLLFFGIRNVSVVQRKQRDYLDVTMTSPVPSVEIILSLPAYSDPIQQAPRTLLAALLEAGSRRGPDGRPLDLRVTAGTMYARRGDGGATPERIATFIDLFLDTGVGEHGDYERLFPPRESAIGGSYDDLANAVNAVRALLLLPPQFQSQ